MNKTPDTSQTAASGSGGEFSPRDAATLLEQATRQARRQFEPYPPLGSLIRAGIAIAAYGTIWLSVRGQHPYKWPDAAAILIVIALAVVNLGAAVAVAKRAVTGVSGRLPMRPAEIAIMAVAWTAVFAVMAALASAGASRAVVYGWYPAAMPLIVAGIAWAGIMAARADWPASGTALAVAAVGTGSAFAGPVGAWAVAGSGVCAVLVGKAALIAWRQRAGTTHP
jgi:hypothetical protein